MSEQQPYAHEREHEPEPQPRVWIGSLGDYVGGRLTGDWVDAAVEDEELIVAATRIVRHSEDPLAEEWAIFDYDNFGDWKPGEYEDLALVARIARGIRDHGQAYAAWPDLHDAEPDMLDAFEDCYLGHYASPADWAREVMDDSDIEQRIETTLGEHLACHVRIDYEGFARDASLGGDIHFAESQNGGVWVFHANP